MKKLNLNGEWKLTGYGEHVVGPLKATVPGNIEIELEKNGIVPALFVGCNEDSLRPYEFYDWTFEKSFDVPEDFPAEANLEFDGIDCVAEIYLNGISIASVANAFIRHTLPVDNVIKRGGRNYLGICIKSPILEGAKYEVDHHERTSWRNQECLVLRKPAHEFGWDITPRMCLGGIWRDVRLVERPQHRLVSYYFDVMKNTNASSANILFTYSLETSLKNWTMLDFDIEMSCGDSMVKQSFRQYSASGHYSFNIANPKLWWPAGYGAPDMYDASIRVSADGQSLLEEHCRVGVRSMDFEYDENPEHFMARFIVNGTPIMVKGSNWVPADCCHSRDKDRIIPILELFSDLGCNMLRVWGGGVYEPQEFYDYCDDHGIMVWQDFMVACTLAPLTDEFRARFAREVEWVVKEYRQHPCIALWAGDNEVDQMCNGHIAKLKPSGNRLTREVIPQILYRLDPNRPYQPSSPYYSQTSEDRKLSREATPEQHIWGPRDYFKSPFYSDNNAVFISETGYHGANSVVSMKKFLTGDNVWPWKTPGEWKNGYNEEWHTHATRGYWYRVPLMFKQIREEFMFDPANAEDFATASQLSQAEAKKFFVENVRIHKWQKAGILWWNIMDCWPQFSDAIVDYYFDRKIAYNYLKRSQKPLLGIVGEWKNWGHEVVMTNDTLQPFSGKVTVSDAETDEILLERDFNVSANGNQTVGKFELPNSDQRLLFIRWTTTNGISGANHYISGRTPLDFKRYRDVWLPKINGLGC